MLKFTPSHGVIYKGILHKGGELFEIDNKDREEMARYGVVEAPATAPAAPVVTVPAAEPPPTRKAGRPRKVVSE